MQYAPRVLHFSAFHLPCCFLGCLLDPLYLACQLYYRQSHGCQTLLCCRGISPEDPGPDHLRDMSGALQQPNLLKCFHVYCEQCLQRLVREGREGQSLPCPQCHQDTSLPVGGGMGLQGAFYIHYLFNIQDTLKKMSSGNHLMFSTCSKREVVCFCCTCWFVCGFCEENHQYWVNLKPMRSLT